MESQITQEEIEQRKMDEKYMREAIRQAKKAYALEEVPIGCVIVYEGKIIGAGEEGICTGRSSYWLCHCL